MRALFALFLFFLALLFLFGEVAGLVSKESAPLGLHVCLVSQGVMALISGFYIWQPAEYWFGRIACPNCHERHSLVMATSTVTRRRPSLFAMLMGGIIITVLLQHSHETRFHCSACTTESDRRT